MKLTLITCTTLVAATLISGSLATTVGGEANSQSGGWPAHVEERLIADEYSIRLQTPDSGTGWQSPNRAQGFRTFFDIEGARVIPRLNSEAPNWEWSLSGVGCVGEQFSDRTDIATDGDRIEYRRANHVEWYRNGPTGLEHGLTLYSPPSEGSEEPLELDFCLTSSLQGFVMGDGESITFRTASGDPALNYSKLVVTDATGRSLPARMKLFVDPDTPTRSGIRLVVDASTAVYPVVVDPLITSPTWSAEADQATARMGISIASAGDVNGDGFTDIIVGAAYYDNGQSDEGAAFVFHGAASGPSTTPVWVGEADQAGAIYGSAVATAGDVNADGFADVIVGARFYDNGQTNEGAAFVYFGSATGLSLTPNWTAESDQVLAYFGFSVATAGDVNGDGFADVIVGADRFDNGETDEGAAFVYHGSATGPSLIADWIGDTDNNSAFIGNQIAVSTAGDVNGDGFADIVFGAAQYDNGEANEGAAFVHLGSASGLDLAPVWVGESNQASSRFGHAVAAAGDVDGDGYSDLLIGASTFDDLFTNEGRAYLYRGSASGPELTAAWTFDGDQDHANVGIAVATAGDVNGDGFSDIVIGAPLYDAALVDEGAAFLFLGSLTGVESQPARSLYSGQTGAYFGGSVGAAGDVNGDGYGDLVVGARNFDGGETDEGAAFLFLGTSSDLAELSSFTWNDPTNSNFGRTVRSAGDVNGDGIGDLMVSGRSNTLSADLLHLFLGSENGISATADWFAGLPGISSFGWSSGSPGDFNGDGYSDFLTSAPLYNSEAGIALVFSGSASGFEETGTLEQNPTWIYPGDPGVIDVSNELTGTGDFNGDGLGDAVLKIDDRPHVFLGSEAGLRSTSTLILDRDLVTASTGDFNGDGYSDLAMWSVAGGTDTIDVFNGSAGGLLPVPGWSRSTTGGSGLDIATAGDVNGDGFDDLLVGLPNPLNNPVAGEGTAEVFLGSALGLSQTAAWSAYPNVIGTRFGESVSTAGDVNGDGFSDIVIGAPRYTDGEINEGAAFLYLGSPTGPATLPSWFFESNEYSIQMGRSVVGAGDLNGDGYDDIAIGGGGVRVFYGNERAGLSLKGQQRTVDDSAPVAALGWSDSETSIRLSMTARSPFGRGRVRLQWEVKPLSSPFDGSGLGESAIWTDSGVAGVELSETVSGLEPGRPYHWRMRLLYHPLDSPFAAFGRWLAPSLSGWNQQDFRTRLESDLQLAQMVNLTDSILTTENLVYQLQVDHNGTNAVDVGLTQQLPGGAQFVSALPSQGLCSGFATAVTCEFGVMSGGDSATVTVTATPSSTPGLATSTAEVLGPFHDTLPGDNAGSEETTIFAPAIGGGVWDDLNGDGLQDPGEPPIEGVLVALLDALSQQILLTALTDLSGQYLFSPLDPAADYVVRVFPPAGQALTAPDQGANDSADSDTNPVNQQTPSISIATAADLDDWDAGLIPLCTPPDEPVYISGIRLDVADDAILDFQDPNQLSQVTGYNVYRSSDGATPPLAWPLIASDVVDMDEATPNRQWVDSSGDLSPTGVWFYQITAFNHRCPAEGPR